MPWHYKHPSTFPASYGAAIKVAHTSAVPHMLGSWFKKSDAETLAERIRHYKYCIRNTPAHELQEILENFDVRTSIEANDIAFTLWLTVRPTKISDFVEHNPKLAKDILANL